MTKIISTFLLLLCLSLSAFAQETPEAVAKAYMDASTAGDWTKAASFMHPDALASLKRVFGEMMKLDKSNEAGKQLFGLKSNAEFSSLSDTEVFARVFTGLTSTIPQMKEAVSMAQSKIIGSVPEDSDVTHVVYRRESQIQGGKFSKLAVISLKKTGNTWRALLTGDMEGMMTAIAKSAEGQDTPPAIKKPSVPAKRPVRKK